jgi:hypothetical protein
MSRKMPMDWEFLGAMLANESDNEQVKFLKQFCKEMHSWGTRFEAEQQLASVNRGLTREERELLSMLGYEGKE